MEELFKALIVNAQYKVEFGTEEYLFQPVNGNENVSFSLRREHDEWHGAEDLSPEIRQEAVDALEKYLLKQH